MSYFVTKTECSNDIKFRPNVKIISQYPLFRHKKVLAITRKTSYNKAFKKLEKVR